MRWRKAESACWVLRGFEQLRDIKAVELREYCVSLIDPKSKYHNEMCPIPLLYLWIQVKHYFPLGTEIE